ncbi:MAG: UDP-glucose/GDP-mannose dehydrogenase family protein [Proteobacteria bacterium]|nr:UDP-glucose/GDP-mannose dehydrogenase family protein [Pseudomonadota bacterium]MCP4920175.1 UDP-glucose/GDP-mannose dehydrogenase family protein [Pseudomonadota bacterium]
MKIAVVGTGYVGLVAGTCLADTGHDVVCIDKDQAKVDLLQSGGVPIFEPGLDQLIARNVREGRLRFTAEGPATIGDAQVAYIAVGTPSAADGSADLSGVHAVAALIGKSATGPITVVIKSTVPVGTADQVREIVGQHCTFPFDVVSNPEFLKEGAAIDDFMKPDRIVIGCKEESSREVMTEIYRPLLRTGKPILFMDNRSAELSKYAANAFLATKISFINELSRLCEKVGADVDAVRRGAGTDSRIGLRFFFPGVGYGGSCFPKDVKALMSTAQDHGHPLSILEAVEDVNQAQKRWMAEKILGRHGGDLSDKRFAIWGLSFKPNTDDMREAPSVEIIEALLGAGATVTVYDPEAMSEARHSLGDRVTYAESAGEAVDGADALVLVTEWNEFRNPNLEKLAGRMRGNEIYDGRNLYEPDAVRAAGFLYEGVGRR